MEKALSTMDKLMQKSATVAFLVAVLFLGGCSTF
jgi:hypothetical protein